MLMIERTPLSPQALNNDIEKFKHTGLDYNNSRIYRIKNDDIIRTKWRALSLSNYEETIDIEEKDGEKESLIQSLMDSSSRVQIVKDFQKDSVYHDSLGPE